MSRFMFTIASPGLMDSPPVSKVMPLPTSTTWPRAPAAPRGRVVEPDQPRRGRRGLADGEDAAEALGRELLLVPDLDARGRPRRRPRGRRSASQAGFLRLEGTVASVRARQPAPADGHRPVEHRARGRRGSASTHPAYRLVPWRPAERAVEPERRRASVRRRTPAGRRRRRAGDRGGHDLAVPARAGQRGAGGPEVASRRRRRRPRPAAPRGPPAWPSTGCRCTSPALPVASWCSSRASRSSPSSSARSAAPGPRRDLGAVRRLGRQHRQRPRSTGSPSPRACRGALRPEEPGGETCAGSASSAVGGHVSRRRP